MGKKFQIQILNKLNMCINAVVDGLSRKVCSGEFGELADYGQREEGGGGGRGGTRGGEGGMRGV